MRIKSQYLCELLSAFESKHYVCFGLKYCAGGTLHFHLKKLGRFPERVARYYFY